MLRMNLSIFITLCVFFIRIVSSSDHGLILRKIRDLNWNMHQRIIRLEESVTTRLDIKMHHLGQELTGQIQENSHEIAVQSMDNSGIEHLEPTWNLLNLEFGITMKEVNMLGSTFSKCRATCTCNSAVEVKELYGDNQNLCPIYQENKDFLARSVDKCMIEKQQLMDYNYYLTEKTRSKTSSREMGLEEELARTSKMNVSDKTSLIPSTNKNTTEKSRYQQEVNTFIIMPFYTKASQPWGQMDLECYTVEEQGSSHIGAIRTAVFIRKENRFLMGLTGNKIVTINYDGSEKKVIRRGIETYGMALDEDDDAVYMSTHTPLHRILKLSSDGKTLTTVAYLELYSWLFDIVIDTRERNLYVHNKRHIILMTLEGEDVRVIAHERGITALAMEHSGNLFYVVSGTLMVWSLDKRVNLAVTQIGFDVESLILRNDKIYFTEKISNPWGSTKIIGVIEPEEGFVTYTIPLVKRYSFRLALM